MVVQITVFICDRRSNWQVLMAENYFVAKVTGRNFHITPCFLDNLQIIAFKNVIFGSMTGSQNKQNLGVENHY